MFEFEIPSWESADWNFISLLKSNMEDNSGKPALLQPTSDASLDDVPQSFLCPISYKLMLDPVIMLQSGQSYDRESIESWLKRGGRKNDPVTGMELKTTAYCTNWALRDVIRQWATDHGHSLPTPKPPGFYAQQGVFLGSLDKTVAVIFDDSDFDKAVPLSQILPRNTGPAGLSESQPQSLSLGSSCWAPYQGRYDRLYPGRILAETPPAPQSTDPTAVPLQTLAIAFDDGDRDDRVPAHEVYLDIFDPVNSSREGAGATLELGTRVYATYQGSSRVYPGIVTTPLPTPPPVNPNADPPADPDNENALGLPPPHPAQETFVIVSYDDGDYDGRVPLSSIYFEEDEAGSARVGRRCKAPWHGSTRLWEGRVLSEDEARKDVEAKLNRAVEGLKSKSRRILHSSGEIDPSLMLTEAYALAKKVQWMAADPDEEQEEEDEQGMWIQIVRRAPMWTIIGISISVSIACAVVARKK